MLGRGADAVEIIRSTEYSAPLNSPGRTDAIPEMLPDDARWIDIDQVAPPSIIERKPEPTDLSRGVVLVAIVVVMTLGTIEALFRGTILLAGGAPTGRNRGSL